MKIRWLIIQLVVCGLPFCASYGAGWSLVDLGTLGGSSSLAGCITESKLVSGDAWLSGDQNSHAFLYRRGQLLDLAPLNSGLIRSATAPAINNRGVIATGVESDGYFVPALHDSRSGRTWLLGTLSDADFYGFKGVASTLNNRGQAAGWSYVAPFIRHAFVWSDGVMVDLGSLAGDHGFSAATAINDQGLVAGFSSAADGRTHAFLCAEAEMLDINPPGMIESTAEDINQRGEVVGYGVAGPSGPTQGFVYRGGQFRLLGSLAPSRSTYALAINTRGQIVGAAEALVGTQTVRDPDTGKTYQVPVYDLHAFLWDNGRMIDLNSALPPRSGWSLQWAADINAGGDIVGYGKKGPHLRAFLLKTKALRGNR